MSLRLAWCICCSVLAFGALEDDALAQNPRSVPIGGRTATMGGAGTAVGNDSAMPYLNPAGLAGLPGDVFAVSASLYQYDRRTFEGLFRPRGIAPALGAWRAEDETIESGSVSELPTSVMYVKDLQETANSRQLFGMALVVPSRGRLEIRGESRIGLLAAQGFDRQTISVSSSSTDYYIGPTWALSLGDNLRLGASLFGLYTQHFSSSDFADFTSLFGGTQISLTQFTKSQDIRTFSLVPVVGAQLQVSPKVWLGVGVGVPSIHVWGHERTITASSAAGPSGTPSGVVVQDNNFVFDGEARDQRPFRINFGAAYEDREQFSAAIDVSYFGERAGARSFSGRRRGTSFISNEIPRQLDDAFSDETDIVSVVDVAAGAELSLSSIFALRAGGFADLANTPEMDKPTGGVFRIRENRFGGTLGLGTTFGSFDSTIGVVYAHSEGTIVTLDASSLDPNPFATAVTRSDAVMFVFSGSVTVAEAKETIRRTSPVQFPLDTPETGVPNGQQQPPRSPPTQCAPCPATAPVAPAPVAPAPVAPAPVAPPPPPPSTPPEAAPPAPPPTSEEGPVP